MAQEINDILNVKDEPVDVNKPSIDINDESNLNIFAAVILWGGLILSAVLFFTTAIVDSGSGFSATGFVLSVLTGLTTTGCYFLLKVIVNISISLKEMKGR